MAGYDEIRSDLAGYISRYRKEKKPPKRIIQITKMCVITADLSEYFTKFYTLTVV